MSYSIVRSATGGPDHLVENPDPALMTPEARRALAEEILAVRQEILDQRGGVPLDVDAIIDEMRAERGLRSAGMRGAFEQTDPLVAKSEVAQKDASEPRLESVASKEARAKDPAPTGRRKQQSYSIVRSATGGPDHIVIDPDPKLLTREAREEFLRKADEVNAAILKRRNGVPIDVEEILEEIRSERGTDSA